MWDVSIVSREGYTELSVAYSSMCKSMYVMKSGAVMITYLFEWPYLLYRDD